MYHAGLGPKDRGQRGEAAGVGAEARLVFRIAARNL
jgi:hypothetical protein